MTIRLTGLSRRSFLRTGTAFGLATGAAGLKMPAYAQSGLPDIQATLDGISVAGYVREDYRKLYSMSDEPLWDPARDWIRHGGLGEGPGPSLRAPRSASPSVRPTRNPRPRG